MYLITPKSIMMTAKLHATGSAKANPKTDDLEALISIGPPLISYCKIKHTKTLAINSPTPAKNGYIAFPIPWRLFLNTNKVPKIKYSDKSQYKYLLP